MRAILLQSGSPGQLAAMPGYVLADSNSTSEQVVTPGVWC